MGGHLKQRHPHDERASWSHKSLLRALDEEAREVARSASGACRTPPSRTPVEALSYGRKYADVGQCGRQFAGPFPGAAEERNGMQGTGNHHGPGAPQQGVCIMQPHTRPHSRLQMPQMTHTCVKATFSQNLVRFLAVACAHEMSGLHV